MAPVVLLTTTMAHWPAAILQRSFPQATLAELPTVLGPWSQSEPQPCCWLGYSSPLDCLHQALLAGHESDLSDLLDQWKHGVETFLQLKRTQPQACLLLNLPKLTSVAVAELLSPSEAETANDEGQVSERTEPAQPLWSTEPQALMHLVISQRRDLLQLYADLEAQADLLGREPEFQLNLPASSDPRLGEELLREWQKQREGEAQRLRALVDNEEQLRHLLQVSQTNQQQLHEHNLQLESELQAVRLQASRNSERAEDLLESLRSAEGQLAVEVNRSADSAAEALAQLQDSEEEKELILLQLKQVQEELGNTFQTLQACQSENHRLETDLNNLQQANQQLQTELLSFIQESRYLFLHSKLLDTVDHTRLSRILNLMRQSLQA